MPLFDELKRRNVFKVGIAYVIMSWLVLQVADVILNNIDAPGWVFHVLLLFLGVGFLFTVFFAWAFELTPEGLKREHEVDRSQSITQKTGRKLDFVIIGVLLLALSYFVYDKLVLSPTQESAIAKANSQADSEQAVAEQEAGIENEKSIAVLPFVNMSDDAANEYFSDGISEELLNLLARIPELRVAARTSSFSFKGRNVEVQEVAERLKVAHVLEGSVRKAGNRVRITAQLIKAEGGYHLWSRTFDRTLDDIFAIQDEIAVEVVDALKVTLLGDAPRVKKVDPEAYALYLQAMHLGSIGTEEALHQSNALLKQALVIAPDYAKAWRGLSRNYSNQVYSFFIPRDEGLVLAREAIDQALTIDPYFAEAYSSLGWQAMSFEGDLKSAARHIGYALSLEPTNSIVLNSAASLMWALGRIDEGGMLDKYLAATDPLSPVYFNNLTLDYIYLGQPEKAIATANTLLLLNSERPHSYLLQARALLLMGENEAALKAIQKEPMEHYQLFGLVVVYHALDQKSESDAALADFIEKYGQTRPYHIAGSLAIRGEADRAFEWLEKAAALDTSESTWNLHDPMFANIHDDPRWLPFLESIGMSPAQLAAIEFEVTLPE